jgi:protein-S-isoprenylcysteine O-methyltransferase Ste14
MVMDTPLQETVNLIIIFVGVLLTYPLVWLGRKILDHNPTRSFAIWITTFIHFGLGLTFGVPIILAVTTCKSWTGWILPVPHAVGLVLVIVTGVVFLLTVVNLALKGLGAPFFIVLSQKLATDWMYSRTRNPMVLAGLSLLISLGIWYRSAFFLLWAIVIFAPALLFFIKIYEEKELEVRFGQSYLDYKSRTPMLFPKKHAG